MDGTLFVNVDNAEAKRQVKLLYPLVFAHSFATLTALQVKKFNPSTKTKTVLVSCSTSRNVAEAHHVPSSIVVEIPVAETTLHALKSGKLGLDDISKHELVRKRLSPVTASQGASQCSKKISLADNPLV